LKIFKTKINGLILIQPKKFFDTRGYFLESYNSKTYSKIGVKSLFVQDNLSISKRNVLRGLHYQNKKPQGKLVSVIKGSILDVAVDIRKNSKTFGNHQTFILSEKNCMQLWIPRNFAHGFLTMSSNTIVSYKCTDFYDPSDQNTIIWNDKTLDIPWPTKKPIISEKDKKGILFENINS